MSLSDRGSLDRLQQVPVQQVAVETEKTPEPHTLSHAGQVVLSLIEDIDAERGSIVAGSPDSVRQAERVLERVQLAYKQAEACPPDENAMVLSEVLMRDAMIHVQVLGVQPGGAGKKAILTAISRAERAVAMNPQTSCKMTLAGAYVAGGQKKKAIPLLEAVAGNTDDSMSIAAQKWLLEVRQEVADEGNIALQLVSFVSAHPMPVGYLVVSLVFFLVSTRVEHIVALWFLLRIGWFLNLILGLFYLLKELATKKPS